MPVDEVSIGDYVLVGGEVAVLVMVEAVVRLLPGVLGNPALRGAGLVLRRAARRPRPTPGRRAGAASAVPGGAAQRRPRRDRPVAARPGAGAHRGTPARPARRAAADALDAADRAFLAGIVGREHDFATTPRPSGTLDGLPRPTLASGRRADATSARASACPQSIRTDLAMNTLDALDAQTLRSDIPAFRPGDTLKVHVKVIEGSRSRIQVFQGVVIRRQGAGVRETFTVRKIVVRRRRRAHLPGALAEHRPDRGGHPRRRPSGEALLPA